MADEADKRYARAYTEVLEVLKYMPRDSVDKIPISMLNVFIKNRDVNYDYHIDTSKPFEEQELSEETMAIFANIFRDYWATPEQREIILKKEEQDRKKMKLQKYKSLLEEEDN